MNFDSFVKRFDSGEIGLSEIEDLLTIVYGSDQSEEKSSRRSRVIRDGQIVKFQAVGLNKEAQVAFTSQKVQVNEPPPEIDVPQELLSDVPEEVYDSPDLVPEIKSRVGIIQAVRTWGKPQAVIRDNRVEGVKVRCPFPHHNDENPSAWVNQNQNIWYCGKCQVGGDVIDFYAAAKHGLTPSDFHSSREFPRIVEQVSAELGIRLISQSDGSSFVQAESSEWESNRLDPEPTARETQPEPAPKPLEPEPEPEPPPVRPESPPPSPEADEPITISDDEMLRGVLLPTEQPSIEDMVDVDAPVFEWRSLDIPEGTFLHEWMLQAEEDFGWVAPEYFLALGIQAVGIACSHKTTSKTFGVPLTGSMMVVLVGSTAAGKSTAVNCLKRLLSDAVGPKWDATVGLGVKRITSTASAEALMQRMRTEIVDPSDPKGAVEIPTNGWYFEDEFAVLVSKSRRQGGEHIKQRIMAFHDFYKSKDHPELVVEDHSVTGGYRSVHDSYFNATFLAQPEALPDLAESRDLVSGFMNRMTFVMGNPRRERLLTVDHTVDFSPAYIAMYERLWKDCNLKKRVVEFDDEAKDLADFHPLSDRLRQLTHASPMFSRWQIMVLRCAFLLAVNENSPYVEARHISGGFRLVAELFVPSASNVVGYVKAGHTGPKAEAMACATRYVQNYFDRNGYWPEPKHLKNTRSWRRFDPEIRERAMQLLAQEKSMVKVFLTGGPIGQSKRAFLVLAEGQFSVFSESNEKTYSFDDFYANRGDVSDFALD